MDEFIKENFTGHTKFHPKMVMFILETMVSRYLEGVSGACVNVSTLPVTVQKLASSVDTFDSCLCALESTDGLEVGERSGSVEKLQMKPDQKERR